MKWGIKIWERLKLRQFRMQPVFKGSDHKNLRSAILTSLAVLLAMVYQNCGQGFLTDEKTAATESRSVLSQSAPPLGMWGAHLFTNTNGINGLLMVNYAGPHEEDESAFTKEVLLNLPVVAGSTKVQTFNLLEDIHPGDVNQDGTEDLLVWGRTTSRNGQTTNQFKVISFVETPARVLRESELSGQGLEMQDIRLSRNGYLYLSSASGTAAIQSANLDGPWFQFSTDVRPVAILDLNGDKIPDRITYRGKTLHTVAFGVEKGVLSSSKEFSFVDQGNLQIDLGSSPADFADPYEFAIDEYELSGKKKFLLRAAQRVGSGSQFYHLTVAQLFSVDQGFMIPAQESASVVYKSLFNPADEIGNLGFGKLTLSLGGIQLYGVGFPEDKIFRLASSPDQNLSIVEWSAPSQDGTVYNYKYFDVTGDGMAEQIYRPNNQFGQPSIAYISELNGSDLGKVANFASRSMSVRISGRPYLQTSASPTPPQNVPSVKLAILYGPNSSSATNSLSVVIPADKISTFSAQMDFQGLSSSTDYQLRWKDHSSSNANWSTSFLGYTDTNPPKDLSGTAIGDASGQARTFGYFGIKTPMVYDFQVCLAGGTSNCSNVFVVEAKNPASASPTPSVTSSISLSLSTEAIPSTASDLKLNIGWGSLGVDVKAIMDIKVNQSVPYQLQWRFLGENDSQWRLGADFYPPLAGPGDTTVKGTVDSSNVVSDVFSIRLAQNFEFRACMGLKMDVCSNKVVAYTSKEYVEKEEQAAHNTGVVTTDGSSMPKIWTYDTNTVSDTDVPVDSIDRTVFYGEEIGIAIPILNPPSVDQRRQYRTELIVLSGRADRSMEITAGASNAILALPEDKIVAIPISPFETKSAISNGVLNLKLRNATLNGVKGPNAVLSRVRVLRIENAWQ